MSLILEALRKSEAERRRGRLPDLHAELPPAARSARPRRPAWPWVVALVIIAVVATTWLARGLWAPTPPADLPSERVLPSPPGNAGVAGEGPAGAAVATDRAAASTVAPPDAVPPVADVGPATQPPAVSTPAPAESPPVPSRRPAPAAPAARDRDAATAPAATAVPPTVAPTPPPAASPAPSRVAPPSAEPGAAVPASGKRTPLRLSELAAAERRALPPLQISMHMWAPTPAGRFAIIDGARVNEGDRLGDAIVDEITRDGIVLAWQGRRVHIPIQ